MSFTPDLPVGVPSFGLSEDEIATVVDLTCQATQEIRQQISPNDLEVPITIMVRKAMRRVKRKLGLTNLEVRGEHEIENMAAQDATLLGRIDITMKFLRQFGDEDDYVAIECKRVGAGAAYSQLNGRYVTEGVVRFVNGQYAVGQAWGFMLGYVLSLPEVKIVTSIDKLLRKTYGQDAKLTSTLCHADALAIHDSKLVRRSGSPINLRHIFVDMTPV